MNALAATAQLELVIGQVYGGGHFIGITQEDGKLYRNIQAPKAFELRGVIGCYGVDVAGARSYADSRSNTEAYAAAGSELAQRVVALVIGEQADWGIPARDVQELQYRHMKPTAQDNYCTWRDGDNPSSVPAGYPYTESSPGQTSLAAFQEGGKEAFGASWYVSSTQFSAYYAFHMDFSDGYQFGDDKLTERSVRPVRRELIQ
ncbi:DUF1566 domain-containing protein [Pseudomonas sp. WS 5059]|uniref:DUF1566 domain-containing protein n=1 Tax=Pseudomonas sp. WS 5059 TaxID=2717491 RepID=UPI00147272BB|nr:DUF1566 domain-containing protein [Pseudomonas sp. WS 5059]NMY04593.1 DUF1566 domain-containing protein [Pseudomonas sp. WS 5059]